jgi:hypothetical protein
MCWYCIISLYYCIVIRQMMKWILTTISFTRFIVAPVLTNAWNKCVEQLQSVFIMQYKVWPVVNFFIFTFIPEKLRVLAGNIAAVFWNAYLCTRVAWWKNQTDKEYTKVLVHLHRTLVRKTCWKDAWFCLLEPSFRPSSAFWSERPNWNEKWVASDYCTSAIIQYCT